MRFGTQPQQAQRRILQRSLVRAEQRRVQVGGQVLDVPRLQVGQFLVKLSRAARFHPRGGFPRLPRQCRFLETVGIDGMGARARARSQSPDPARIVQLEGPRQRASERSAGHVGRQIGC